MAQRRTSRHQLKRDPENADGVLFDDVATLKAVADPLRIRLLMLMGEQSCTVKELAATLAVPPTRLYYHVNILEEHGLIEVVERRMVSGIEERRYQATAKSWGVSPDLTTDVVGITGVLQALLDMVRAEVELAMHDNPGGAIGDPDSALPIATLAEWALTREDLVEVQGRFNKMMEDFGGDHRESVPRYRLLFLGYPTPEVRRAP